MRKPNPPIPKCELSPRGDYPGIEHRKDAGSENYGRHSSNEEATGANVFTCLD